MLHARLSRIGLPRRQNPRACLRFAAAKRGAQSYTLVAAAFSHHAITVYERAGFAEVERFEHATNGGLHTFIQMAKSTAEPT